MQTHIQKWGNSLGVRIPSTLSRQLHLSPGSPINIEIEGDRLIIYSPRYSLEAMLDSITNHNLHHAPLLEYKPVGNEEW